TRRGLGKSAEIRHRPWRERRRLRVHNYFRGGRQRQGLPGAPARVTTSQQADVLRAEYLVLGRAFLQTAASGRIPRSREPGGTDCWLRSQDRGITRWGVARSHHRAIRRAKLSERETGTRFE